MTSDQLSREIAEAERERKAVLELITRHVGEIQALRIISQFLDYLDGSTEPSRDENGIGHLGEFSDFMRYLREGGAES